MSCHDILRPINQHGLSKYTKVQNSVENCGGKMIDTYGSIKYKQPHTDEQLLFLSNFYWLTGGLHAQKAPICKQKLFMYYG